MYRIKPKDPSTYSVPITIRPDGVEVSYPGFSRDYFFHRSGDEILATLSRFEKPRGRNNASVEHLCEEFIQSIESNCELSQLLDESVALLAGRLFVHSGLLRLDKLEKLVESSRAFGWKFTEALQSSDVLTSGYFLISISVEISPELHLMTVGKRSFPFTVVTILTGAQRSSFGMVQSLYKTGDRSKELLRSSSVVVHVSLDLRRPSPLPARLKSIVKGTRKPQERVQIPEIPASAFRYEVEVQPHHIDYNQHTNHTSYTIFCGDAAAAAAKRSLYKGIQTLTELPILEEFTMFIGESSEGSSLVIATWQDNKAKGIIHFVVTLKEKTILYSRWRLGDSVSKPKL